MHAWRGQCWWGAWPMEEFVVVSYSQKCGMGKWLEEGAVLNRPESTRMDLYSLSIIGSLRDESLWKVHVELGPNIIQFLLPIKHTNAKDHSWRHLTSHWNNYSGWNREVGGLPSFSPCILKTKGELFGNPMDSEGTLMYKYAPICTTKCRAAILKIKDIFYH